MVSSQWDWLLAAHPRTLAAAVIPAAAGSGLAATVPGAVVYTVWRLWVPAALLLQAGTQLVSSPPQPETEKRAEFTLSPLRGTHTSAGDSKGPTTHWLAVLCFTCTLLLMRMAAAEHGWPVLLLAAWCILAAHAFNGGPYVTAFQGVTDAALVILYGVVFTSAVRYLYLDDKLVTAASAVAGLQVGMTAAQLQCISSLQDQRMDATLMPSSLRLTRRVLRVQIALQAVLPYLLGGYWLVAGMPLAALLPLVTAPLALATVAKVISPGPGREYSRFQGWAGATHLAFGMLLAMGLAASAGARPPSLT